MNQPMRQWREDHGLTLSEIAGLTGYSVPYVSRIERGERNLRPLDRIRVARSLGADVSELFAPGQQAGPVAEADQGVTADEQKVAS
jgi:transcriptional regulator with XRE-family HTH domain